MNDPLKGLFTQYWLYLAVRAACRVNLFDALRDQGATEAELHEMLKTDPKATTHLVWALIYHGYLRSDNDRLELTQLSERLTEDHPKSMKYACLLWGGEHMDVWQTLDDTIRYGRPVFPSIFGKDFFDYLDNNEQESSEYHRAMYEYARDDYRGIDKLIDLTEARTCADIGGANGALVEQLAGQYPKVKFTIFDKQDHSNPSATNVNFVQGDFFEGIPMLGDVYLLSRVLHDWNDEMATRILICCLHSLPIGGELYVIENDLSKLGDGGHLLSLNMMAVCDSFERGVHQYEKILGQAGFSIKSIKNHNHLVVIKAFKE